MASISFGNSFRLLGRGHLGTVSSRTAPSAFSRSELGLRRGFTSLRQQSVLGLSYKTSRSLPLSNRFLLGLVFTRHYSKDSPAPAADATVPSATPTEEVASAVASTPASEAVSDTASTFAETAASLDAIHTPLQYGDLAALGLTGWSPAGIIRWTLEIINTTTHLPWFWTIVAGTVFWRLLVAPSSVSALRNSSRLHPYTTEIAKVQAEMGEAAKKDDRIAKQKAALKLKEVYDKAGVNMTSAILAPFVNIPVTLGTFFGIRTLCSTPVEQLKWSGLDILPDLTIADPTWALPIILTALVNVQISVGTAEMDTKTRPGMAHIMNGIRLLTLPGLFVTATFPAGLVVALVTVSTFTIIQSLALQYTPFRRYLGIKSLPEKSKPPSMRESVEYAIDMIKKRVTDAKEMETHKIQRARASEQMKRFEEARRK